MVIFYKIFLFYIFDQNKILQRNFQPNYFQKISKIIFSNFTTRIDKKFRWRFSTKYSKNIFLQREICIKKNLNIFKKILKIIFSNFTTLFNKKFRWRFFIKNLKLKYLLVNHLKFIIVLSNII